MASAARCIAQGGPSGLSLRAIAAEQGTSTNAIYAMFGGKPELVGEVIAAASTSFTQSQWAALNSGDTVGDLHRLGHAYRDWALCNPTLFSAIFGSRPLLGDAALPAPCVSDTPESMEPLLTVVTNLIASGDLQAGEPLTIATSIWAAIHGLVQLEISFWPGEPHAAALFEEHLRAGERGWLTPQGLAATTGRCAATGAPGVQST